MILRVFLLGLVCLWFWTFPGKACGQNSGTILDQLLTDPEITISEEDLDRLETLTLLSGRDDATFRHLAEELSFLSQPDLEYLRACPSGKSLTTIRRDEQAPITLKKITGLVSVRTKRRSGPGYLQTRLTDGNVTRWHWKGRWSRNKLAYGWTLALSPDEPLATTIPTAYLEYRLNHTTVWLGDYQILSGLGFHFWRPTAIQKSFTTVQTRLRPNTRIIPYRSSYASWSLRGMAVQRQHSSKKFTLALSRRPIRGIITQDRQLTLNTTGWNAGAIGEAMVVAGMEASLKSGGAGMTLSHATYYKATQFVRRFRLFGYGWVEKNPVALAAEVSLLQPFSGALVLSLKFKPLQYRIMGRYAETEPGGSRTNPMLEWSPATAHEKGIYQGLRFRSGAHTVSLYSDIFRTTGRGPDTGYENGLLWEYHVTGHRVRFLVKQKEKQRDDEIYYTPISPPVSVRITRSLTHYWTVSPVLKLKNQIIIVQPDRFKDHSIGGQTTLYYHPGYHQLEFSLLRAHVNDFASRLYFWDTNLPGEMRSIMIPDSRQSVALSYRYSFPSGSLVAFRARWQWSHFQVPLRFDGGIVFTTAL